MTSSNNTPDFQPSAQPADAPASSDAQGGEQVRPQITEKQARRINAPARNMIISMVVMLLLIIPVLWLMPQPNKNPYRPTVDVPVVAYEASREAGYHVAAAEQEGWHYNYARWNTGAADGINYWSSGQVTPSNHFIELVQAQDANPTWVAQQVGNAVPEAQVQMAGTEWEVRSQVDPDDKNKITTNYIGELEGTTVIMMGEADAPEFESLAEATVAYLKAPSSTSSPTPSSGIE
ncbi:DUF4245 domain-containing protein [Rothia sp. (in: high G+C Gram-positive bacteria)]|uniref:DUF4245 domain-containing protein n=1 Tax=Rothia sp. (in: high G+C Gram-positive bacteria) TaxID=1885016 RepID=UPI000ED3B81C|nr:DUF4245 domain-containing protein [Rothia sp. (in: high G+C Gram-positive bacteria)]